MSGHLSTMRPSGPPRVLPTAAPRPGEAAGTDSEVLRISDVTGALRRGWYVLVACMAIGGTLAAGYAWRTPRVYAASATLRLDEKQPTLPTVYVRRPDPDAVYSEIEVMRARQLAARVVDSLGLRLALVSAPRGVTRSMLMDSVLVASTADTGTYRLTWGPDAVTVTRAGSSAKVDVLRPGVAGYVNGVRMVLRPDAAPRGPVVVAVRGRDAAIDALHGAVHVDRVGTQTNLISLRYEDQDAPIARAVLATWIAAYLEQRQHAQSAEARSTATVLRAQLDTLNAQMRTAENAFERFRERERVVVPEIEANSQVSRLAQLEADRATVDGERRAATELMTDVRASAARARPEDPSPYRRVVAFPGLLKNSAASQLLASLTEVENQRAALLTRRTPIDPDVRILTKRITDIEEQVKSVADTYLAGLGAQVAADDAELARFGAQIARVPQREIEFLRLQRQPALLASIVSTLSIRLKEAQVAESVEDPSLQVVDPAYVSADPVRPRPTTALLAGLLVGAFVGAAGITAKERRNRAIRTRSDVAWAANSPVLGAVPNLALAAPTMRPRRRLGSLSRSAQGAPPEGRALITAPSNGAGRPIVAEDAYTRLCLNVMGGRLWSETGPRSLIVTSPLPGDGKTTSAVNLALTLARRGVRTILVDADLRRGGVDARFGVPRGPGLTEVLRDAVSVDNALRQVAVGNGQELTYLTTGALQHDAPLLLTSTAMHDLHGILQSAFQAIIYDTPPVAVVSDAAVLAPLVDGVILVVRAGATSREAVESAAAELRSVNAPLIGTLLNDVDPSEDGYSASYYAYAAATADGSPVGA